MLFFTPKISPTKHTFIGGIVRHITLQLKFKRKSQKTELSKGVGEISDMVYLIQVEHIFDKI